MFYNDHGSSPTLEYFECLGRPKVGSAKCRTESPVQRVYHLHDTYLSVREPQNSKIDCSNRMVSTLTHLNCDYSRVRAKNLSQEWPNRHIQADGIAEAFMSGMPAHAGAIREQPCNCRKVSDSYPCPLQLQRTHYCQL